MFNIIVGICLPLILSIANSSPILGGSDVGKIVKDANNIYVNGQHKYPFMVYILIFEPINKNNKGKQDMTDCGGVIISETAVLTAAHCLTESIGEPEVFVKAGIVHIKYEKNLGQTSEVDHYVIHQDYIEECKITEDISEFCLNDIAVLFLKKHFVFEINVNKANIIGPEDNPSQKIGTILGWGINDKGKEVKMLQKAKISTISHSTCQRYLSEVKITSNIICVLSDTKTAGICQGDSGGPLIIDEKVYAIASFGRIIQVGNRIKCDPTEPAVYTNLGVYKEWIEKCSQTPLAKCRATPFLSSQPSSSSQHVPSTSGNKGKSSKSKSLLTVMKESIPPSRKKPSKNK